MNNEHLNSLIQGCRRGDRLSQRKVYEHFYAAVFAVCLRYAGSREEAKELTNDAFFKVFSRLEQYVQGSNFGGWVYTIARRTALDRYRVAIHQPQMVELTLLPDTAVHIENQILHRLDADEKLQLVQRLPPAYRLVFNLYVVEEFTHEEIAETLGISIGASKSNLSKARMKLREWIDEHTAFQIPPFSKHG